MMKVLAIESSCDEFAVAIVKDGRFVLSEVVNSQIDIHKMYGGVIPEVAARSHLEVALAVVDECMKGFSWDGIDAIAVTARPGLIGSLMIGTLVARTLAILKKKPLYAVDHIEGHVYAAFLNSENGCNVPQFPFLALVVSGGHTQIMLFRGHSDYEIIGRTIDDAVGEAFDKVAKILGLPYPGGPSVAKVAKNGNAEAYKLPKPRVDGYNFSFSGLKTAVLRAVQHEVGVDHTFPSSSLSTRLTASQRDDFAASFQKTAVEILIEKVVAAADEYEVKSIVLAGGVAANEELRKALIRARKSQGKQLKLFIPKIKWCTDNAAMIGARAYFLAKENPPVDPRDLGIYPTK